jgi:hypothetical protein
MRATILTLAVALAIAGTACGGGGAAAPTITPTATATATATLTATATATVTGTDTAVPPTARAVVRVVVVTATPLSPAATEAPPPASLPILAPTVPLYCGGTILSWECTASGPLEGFSCSPSLGVGYTCLLFKPGSPTVPIECVSYADDRLACGADLDHIAFTCDGFWTSAGNIQRDCVPE